MRIDLYTKIVLTVIALSLSIIAVKDFLLIKKANAISTEAFTILRGAQIDLMNEVLEINAIVKTILAMMQK